jgi:hypothetical protein
MIPKEAVAYLKNKTRVGASGSPFPNSKNFSYRDIWNEEHAANFTVAKAMQMDVLKDIQDAIVQAAEKGETLEHFKKNLRPLLQQKGWWGKKEMTDPLTGETVNAQLGSGRRLKTIYTTNTRQAFLYEKYQRINESDAHPYMMYRVGNSKEHRPEHLEWDGLILPKDDPWWGLHMPQKEYGCKCFFSAITEVRKEKLEQRGFTVPPTSDGTPGHTVHVKTKAPPEVWTTYVNERTGTVERVPKGVHPSFNYDARGLPRNAGALEQLVQKTQAKYPAQFDGVVRSVLKSEANKADFYGFIENALGRNKDRQRMAAVGVLDSRIIDALKKEKINLAAHHVIVLESQLVNGKKYTDRHTRRGNAPAKEDWYNLLDWLIDASVFWDAKGGGLIYLAKLAESRFMKIAVDVSVYGKGHRGVRVNMPKVDTMYVLDLSAESDRGISEYNRIMGMKKIR